jgi:hypothetical protein
MKRRAALVLTTLVLLAGCAKVVYRHPNYTPQLWARDSYECERDARQSGYFGTGLAGALNMQDFFERCLAARGWVRTEE